MAKAKRRKTKVARKRDLPLFPLIIANLIGWTFYGVLRAAINEYMPDLGQNEIVSGVIVLVGLFVVLIIYLYVIGRKPGKGLVKETLD